MEIEYNKGNVLIELQSYMPSLFFIRFLENFLLIIEYLLSHTLLPPKGKRK